MLILNWLWVDEACVLELGKGLVVSLCNKVILNDCYQAVRQNKEMQVDFKRTVLCCLKVHYSLLFQNMLFMELV